ncbi:hypothetical protein EMMF5_003528 [Cystobasidiomycetes sp. EMM_F5]
MSSMSSQMRLLSIGFLVTLAFAAAAMALGTASDSPVGAASIPHSYIMALDADTTKDTRDQIVKTLEAQGAKITSLIDYPGIMQAINFVDTASESGQVEMQTQEAKIQAWSSCVASFGDKVVSVEQDQIVRTQ